MVRKKQAVTLPEPPRALRVAGYARVSSGKDAMLDSLSAQVSYYSKLIQEHPGWQCVGVYADEAYTGTKDARPEFQRMLDNCRAGKIDIVLVKALSRFARNTVTLLSIVRELKDLGVDVWFERENLHTLSAEGEVLLTLIAAAAQEESRSVSENCKWRIRNNYLKGVPKTGLKVYGYKWHDGEYRVVSDEAEVIRSIFARYLSGQSVNEIVDSLIQSETPSPRGNRWNALIIRYILTNERYIGDALLQKEFVRDHISKKKERNVGQLQSVYVEGAHEAIIDKEDFLRVKRIIAQLAEKYAADAPGVRAYPFSGMLICPKCGKPYARKRAHDEAAWNCGTFIRKGKAFCHGKQIPECILIETSAEVLGLTVFSDDIFKQQVKEIIVPAPNQLVFHMADGTTIDRAWKDRSRRDSWDEAARKRASQIAQKRYSK